MSEADALITHWALLIGINFYKDTPLYGSVRDVELIKGYLEKGSSSTPVRIVALTATSPDDPESCQPVEEPDSWPTYDNVTFWLEKIIAEAKPGHFVYIHYSGHGTQTEDTSEFSFQNTGDLLLVLFDLAQDVRYFPSQELGSRLKKMVKKGVSVTLVLDCCFSGSVVRYGKFQDAGIRTIRYDSVIDAAYPREPGGSPRDNGETSLRGAGLLRKWLIEPDGYTILSACGPHEEAKELTLARGGKKHGALSFFLAHALSLLRKNGTEITQQSLYQHMCAQFHVYWPKQTPMLYGKRNLSFFGRLMPSHDAAFIPVFRTGGNNLQLGAGQAHGVCVEDEFAVYPFNFPAGASTATRDYSIKVRADTVRGLTSDLVGIGPEFKIDKVITGWKARPLTSLSSWKVPVRFMATAGDQTQWIAAAKQKRYLALSTEDVEGQPCLFNVTVNERKEYEILDESFEKLTNLPAVPPSTMEINHVVDLLEHLAAFKYFEGIHNRNPNILFEHSFKLHLSDAFGQNMEEAGIIAVKDEDVLCLTVENLSDRPVYVTIFDLAPEWQIDSLLTQLGGGGFIPVPSKDERYSGEEKVKWRMRVPDIFKSQSVDHCDDVLKVFVTSRPGLFAPMLLPKISNGTVRGDHNRISAFLSEVSAPFRGEYDEDWAAYNFLIRTTTKQ